MYSKHVYHLIRLVVLNSRIATDSMAQPNSLRQQSPLPDHLSSTPALTNKHDDDEILHFKYCLLHPTCEHWMMAIGKSRQCQVVYVLMMAALFHGYSMYAINHWHDLVTLIQTRS